MAVTGVDPGTNSWGFVSMEDGKVIDEKIVATLEVREDPGRILGIVKDAELVVAPSGYGLPLKRVGELTEGDLAEIVLKREGEETVMGLEAVLRSFKENDVPAYVIPSVKHLVSVPDFRKRNRIDMGTPDKLCAAVCAIADQAERLGVSYGETDLALCEIGSAFNAFIAVEGGRIIDGIGGTMASSGLRCGGFLDGEVAYLMGRISKRDLLKGGGGVDEYFLDGLLKDIARISLSGAREIVLSGAKAGEVEGYLRKKLEDITIVMLEKGSVASNAAVGAAMLADGLAGGPYSGLVEHLGFKDARGSVLDFTILKDG